MLFAQANTVNPKKTELTLVKICSNSIKLIKVEQAVVIQQIIIRNE